VEGAGARWDETVQTGLRLTFTINEKTVEASDACWLLALLGSGLALGLVRIRIQFKEDEESRSERATEKNITITWTGCT
jgi:hypothetical protein